MEQIDYIPTNRRTCPPTKLYPQDHTQKTYSWFITEDEYLRLCKLFGREFQECNLGSTLVVGRPTPCRTCGKYSEFIDWVWTALRRGVHTADFMFQALKDRRMPKENMHDVYCSQCGTLTNGRSRNNAEGGAPHVSEAGAMRSADYPARKSQVDNMGSSLEGLKHGDFVTWGNWWVDDNGSTKAWRDAMTAARLAQQATGSY